MNSFKSTFLLAAVLLLVGCAHGPPKPPVVDGKQRMPVNTNVVAAALAQRAAEIPPPPPVSQGIPKVFEFMVPVEKIDTAAFELNPEQERAWFPLATQATRIELVGRVAASATGDASAQLVADRLERIRSVLLSKGVASSAIWINTGVAATPGNNVAVRMFVPAAGSQVFPTSAR